MDRESKPGDGAKPKADEQRRREGAESRRELDKVPQPGTDPLHEGP